LLKVIGLCAVFSILFSGAVFAVDTYLSQNIPQNQAELK